MYKSSSHISVNTVSQDHATGHNFFSLTFVDHKWLSVILKAPLLVPWLYLGLWVGLWWWSYCMPDSGSQVPYFTIAKEQASKLSNKWNSNFIINNITLVQVCHKMNPSIWCGEYTLLTMMLYRRVYGGDKGRYCNITVYF